MSQFNAAIGAAFQNDRKACREGKEIALNGSAPRFLVLSDDRVIAEDAAQIITGQVEGADVVCVATLPEAMDALQGVPAPTALLMIEPRRPLMGHPLVAAARERGLSVIVMTEADVPDEALDGKTLLGTRLPFTSQSLGTLISQVVRDRLPG